MTLGRAYELGLTLATSLALLCVLAGGELGLLWWLVLIAPIASLWLRDCELKAPPVLGPGLGVVGIGAGLLELWDWGIAALVLAGTLALCGALAGRLLTRRTLAHDLQALLVSLLLVLAGSIVHTQATYGVLFVLYSVAIVWALLARHLVAGVEREAQRGGAPLQQALGRRDVVTPAFLGATGGLAIALLLSTAALFLVFPRIGVGMLGFFRSELGVMPSDVSLTSEARAAMAGGVVARVRGVPVAAYERGLYLRGPVYDLLTPKGFQRSSAPPLRAGRLAPGPAAVYEVFMQPIAGQTLFALGAVRSTELLAGISESPLGLLMPEQGPQGELRTNLPPSSALRYRVQGELALLGAADSGRRTYASAESLRHYLALPELDSRITALAQSVAGQGDSRAKASRLREHLKRGFSYTLEQPNKDKPHPLMSFLSKTGAVTASTSPLPMQ